MQDDKLDFEREGRAANAAWRVVIQGSYLKTTLLAGLPTLADAQTEIARLEAQSAAAADAGRRWVSTYVGDGAWLVQDESARRYETVLRVTSAGAALGLCEWHAFRLDTADRLRAARAEAEAAGHVAAEPVADGWGLVLHTTDAAPLVIQTGLNESAARAKAADLTALRETCAADGSHLTSFAGDGVIESAITQFCDWFNAYVDAAKQARAEARTARCAGTPRPDRAEWSIA